MNNLLKFWAPLSKKSYFLLSLSFIIGLLFFISLGINQTQKQYLSVHTLKKYLSENKSSIQDWLAGKEQNLIDQYNPKEKAFSGKSFFSDLSDLHQKDYTVQLLYQGEPIFWSKTNLIKIPANLDLNHSSIYLTKQDSIIYQVYIQPETTNENLFWLISLPIQLPDQVNLVFQSEDQKEGLARAVLEKNWVQIATMDVQLQKNQKFKKSLSSLLLLVSAIFLFYLGLIKYKPPLNHPGLENLIKVLIIFISWPFLVQIVDQHFGHFRLFNPAFTQNALYGSLGINFLQSFLILAFTVMGIRSIASVDIDRRYRIYIPSICFLFIQLGIIALASFTQSLIIHSRIPFDFESVFSLDTLSIFGLLCIILYIFSYFLWSIKLSMIANRYSKNNRIKILHIALSTILSSTVLFIIHLNVPLHQFLIVSSIFILLLDIFLEVKYPNFTWVVVWIVIISCFSSALLFKFNLDKELEIRKQVGQILLKNEDRIAFSTIDQIQTYLNENKFEIDQNPRRIARNVIDQMGPYLNTFYNISFVPDIPGNFDRLQNSPYINEAELYSNEYMKGLYYFPLEINDFPLIVKVEQKSQKNPNRVPSLVEYQAFKGIDEIQKYDYAIYYKSECIDRSNSAYKLFLDAEWTSKPASEITYDDNKSNLIHTQGDWTVIVSKQLSGLIKPVSLFSYLFVIAVALLFIILIVDSFVNFLPNELHFKLNRHISLRNKIQISVLTLIIISFIVVAVVTVVYFRNSSDRSNTERLRKTAIALQYEFQERGFIPSRGFPDHELEALAIKYQTPIQLYDIDGKLISTSDNAAFSQGILPEQMDFSSLRLLKDFGESFHLDNREQKGKSIDCAYFTISNEQNQVTGFANIPLYPNSPSEDLRAKDFMGTLLNVYVFLLLVAGAIALAVANSITKPISVLGQKLKEFKFGKTSEPIQWKNKDEFGDLIHKYNQMIFKLKESAELLAQSEREVAWREMAKQVAHEIKNPLTPMKLSIQHLEYTIQKADNEETTLMVRRVAKTLIEQIDNLTKIASEFSSFAKIPKAQNEKINLNELITSVHDLFKKRDDIDINLYVPIDEIFVWADRSHLLRVLNNLIKNAIQAIPGGRKGKIEIRLHTSEESALIEIQDNGIGIPEDMKEKVFFPNFTTKNSGTGLGLAICKNIVESFKGNIYFKTQKDKGTIFNVEIPLFLGYDHLLSSEALTQVKA